MNTKKQQEELAFNKRYSRFKLHAYFQNRNPLTHYGQERYNSTVAQLRFGHVKQIVLDRERGLKDCIDRIELWHKLYTVSTALIYDRRRSTIGPDKTEIFGKEIHKYLGTQLIEWEPNPLTENDKRILCDVCIKNNKISIIPIIPPDQLTIDFKTEIANALNQPNTNHR